MGKERPGDEIKMEKRADARPPAGSERPDDKIRTTEVDAEDEEQDG